MFIDNSSAYSKDLGAEFKKQFEQMGGKVVEEAEYAPSDIDFKGQLAKVKTAAPDVILVPGYYKSAGAISKQAKESGVTAPFLGVDGWDSQDLFVTAGDSLQNSYLSDHMDIHSDKPAVKQFVEDYKKKFPDRKPGALTALGYDSMMILADAMKRAKSLSGADIRDALAATKDFKGVTGDITINKDRNADKPAVILQIKGHDFQYVTTIDQPK
jgi:branched-chain amino acid transport system substrate-binding protein